jgi:hypothetical protein
MSVKPQIIKTPAGEELVVLTRAEYEELISGRDVDEEEAADIALFDERVAALEGGRNPALPPEVTKAMLAGQSLLRALRGWRNMTQVDLASRTELAQGYVSDLEAGKKAGAPQTLRKIAEALEIDPSWMLPQQRG